MTKFVRSRWITWFRMTKWGGYAAPTQVPPINNRMIEQAWACVLLRRSSSPPKWWTVAPWDDAT